MRHDMMAPCASYKALAETVRHHFADPNDTLRKLFSRLAFNILCGNSDDYTGNHAAV